MLNPDNNIKCVELQANVKLGLDDVVVTYEGGEKLFVQVKHTYIVVQQTTHTNMDLPSLVLFLLKIYSLLYRQTIFDTQRPIPRVCQVNVTNFFHFFE